MKSLLLKHVIVVLCIILCTGKVYSIVKSKVAVVTVLKSFDNPAPAIGAVVKCCKIKNGVRIDAGSKVSGCNGIVSFIFDMDADTVEFNSVYTIYFSMCTTIKLNDSLTNVRTTLLYDEGFKNVIIQSGKPGKESFRNIYCKHLDSLKEDNCRFVDLTNNRFSRLPYRIVRHHKNIVILNLDSTNIKRVPRRLRNKLFLTITCCNTPFGESLRKSKKTSRTNATIFY